MKPLTLIRSIALAALMILALSACTSEAPAAATAPPISNATAGPLLGTVAVNATEMEFQPAPIQVDQPGRYTVTFTNNGQIDHDWVAAGTRLVAKPGETVQGEVVVPAEGLAFVCSFPGHAQAGMRSTIRVDGAANAQE